MARNSIRIDAPPEDVYAVLNDADAFKDWVVGAKTIRGTDRSWPAPGARFHHAVGVGPAVIEDSSKIVRKRKNRRMELDVRFRPAGRARVRLDLVPKRKGRATLVKMRENPAGGPVHVLWSRPLDLAVAARNAWSLRRLRRLVEARSQRAS